MPIPMTRKKLMTVALVALIAAFPAYLFFADIQQKRRVYPPDDARTLNRFLDTDRMAYTEVRRFKYAGKTYVSVIDTRPEYFFSLPSGSPVYVFDDSGALVDWCADNGEGAVLLGGWNDWYAGEKITAGEALSGVNSGN